MILDCCVFCILCAPFFVSNALSRKNFVMVSLVICSISLPRPVSMLTIPLLAVFILFFFIGVVIFLSCRPISLWMQLIKTPSLLPVVCHFLFRIFERHSPTPKFEIEHLRQPVRSIYPVCGNSIHANRYRLVGLLRDSRAGCTKGLRLAKSLPH